MTVSVLSVALGLVAAAFLAAGMAIWVVAGRRIVGVMIGLVGALVLVSVAATVASAEGHLVGGPLFVAGLFVFPLVMAVYPTPRARNPIDLLALLTVGTAGALGAIYQDDVAGLMGLCIGTTLFAYVWWKIERADEEERLAILWLAFGSGFPALSAGYESFVNPSTANGVPTAITFLLVPTAMAIGLIRPKIVDVRTLIVGAVVNFSAGLVVFSLFAGVVSYLQIVRDDRLPSIGTLSVVAALCAVGFQSSRVILRGVVDQLLFGDRPDPLVAASQVGESIAADPVLALRAIREALTLPYAALTSGGKHVAASGTPVTNTRTSRCGSAKMPSAKSSSASAPASSPSTSRTRASFASSHQRLPRRSTPAPSPRTWPSPAGRRSPPSRTNAGGSDAICTTVSARH